MYIHVALTCTFCGTLTLSLYRSKSKKSDIDVSSLPGLEALSVPGQLSIHVQCH